LAANNITEGVATGEIDNITNIGDELPLRTENIKNENIKAENQGLVKINLASLQQISAQIKRLHKNKTGEINLQLNPVELGKVEIKVSNDINNNISVQITADLRETYDLLRSDRISLERILQDNGVINGTNNDGLNFDENNLQFAHREGSNNQENNNKHPNNFNEEYENIQQKLIELPIEQMVSLNIVTGINIRV
jgi:flagellar hook-length control protein FliK